MVAINQSIEMFALLLTKFSVIFSIFTGTPQDFSSMVDTKQVLAVNQLPFQSDALIAYLKKGLDAIGKEEVKEAFDLLGSGKALERKKAKKLLIEAGLRSMPFLMVGIKSQDPEIRDSSQEIIAIIKKNSQQDNSSSYIKKFYAIKALGELKSGPAIEILKAFANSSDVTLAEAARISLAACGGEKYSRKSGREAIEELKKMIPDDAGFAAVLNFEEASKEDYLNRLIEVVAKDLGKGNPALSILKDNAPQLEKFILMGLENTGNIRIDAATAYVSENIGPRGGYMSVIVKGHFDKARIEGLLGRSGLNKIDYGKLAVYESRDVAMTCVDNETFIWCVGEGKGISFIMSSIDAVQNKKSSPTTFMEDAFEMVLSGKARFAMSGRLGNSTIDLMNNEIGRELARKENRATPRGDDLLEIALFRSLLAWGKSKHSLAWIDQDLKVHFNQGSWKPEKLLGPVRGHNATYVRNNN